MKKTWGTLLKSHRLFLDSHYFSRDSDQADDERTGGFSQGPARIAILKH